jgi:hypothetical protein
MGQYFLSILQDPRMLGEVHVALLRSIIKDIEDVARTPTTGLGANQNSVMNSGGGHPQVVEGVSFLLFLIFQLSIYFLCSFFKLKKNYFVYTVRLMYGVLI